MPVMMGASFAAVCSMVAMTGSSGIGLPGIFGATIAAGTRGFAHLSSASLTLRLYTSAAWFARLFAMYMGDKVGSHSV